MTAKERYLKAHELNFKEKYPTAFSDGHYFKPDYPQVNKSAGLIKYVENFINWNGYRATRVNVIGRLADKVVTEASGAQFTEKRFARSTRRGTADISATIRGKAVMLEIKAGKDKPSEHQLKEQAKERKAGGIYEFIHTPEEFLELYDKLVNETLF